MDLFLYCEDMDSCVVSEMIGAVTSVCISVVAVAACIIRDALICIDLAMLLSVSPLSLNSDDFSVIAGADATLLPVTVLEISTEPLCSR